MRINLPTKITKNIEYFAKNKFECFVVGGFLRDILLERKKTNQSVDFATNATPEEMLKLFPKAKYENKFGTVLVPLKDHIKKLGLTLSQFSPGEFFEITTYRTEKDYDDSRHPSSVSWGKTIEEDLSRRDFTINSFAYDGKRFIDLFDGLKHLKAKIITTVGSPKKRFSEDALRMMRAVRFASELGFTIDSATLFALSENASNLSNISIERVRDEFLKILASNNPGEGVLLLRNTNLLSTFLPELTLTFGIGQISPERHHIYDVGTHLIKTLEACKNPNPIVRLAALLHDIGKPATRKVLETGVVTFYNHEIIGTEMVFAIAKRLRLSKVDLVKLTKLVRYHQFVVSENMTDNAIRRFIRDLGKEHLNDMLDLRLADRIGSGSKPSSWRLDLFKKRLDEVQKKNPFRLLILKSMELM